MSGEPANSTRSEADLLSEKLYGKPDQEKISLARTMNLGSAGLCVLGLIEIVMAGTISLPLMVAVFSFTVALPMFVGLAMWHEVFLWLGEESYPMFAEQRQKGIARWSSIPLLALYVGICGIILHLNLVAFVLFLLLSVAAYVFLERSITTLMKSLDVKHT